MTNILERLDKAENELHLIRQELQSNSILSPTTGWICHGLRKVDSVEEAKSLGTNVMFVHDGQFFVRNYDVKED